MVNDGMSDLRPTSMAQLKSYSTGQLVVLPPFAEGQPFVARLRRPSLMALAKSGKIPNTLLQSAGELFADTNRALNNMGDDLLTDLYGVMAILCEAAMVEPTYQDVIDAGLELTDEQMTAIFTYTQNGVRALESFRGQAEGDGRNGDGLALRG